MSIERLHQSDLSTLQYCTRCGLVFAMLKPAFEHGERCGPKGVGRPTWGQPCLWCGGRFARQEDYVAHMALGCGPKERAT